MTIRAVAGAAICLAASVGVAGAADDRAALMRAHRGGTLKLTAFMPITSLDPRVSDDPRAGQLSATMYDGLVTTSRVPAEGGATIVPDLAEALPDISPDGRTYVFRLRPGVHFSDGREVTGEDAAASFRRLLAIGPEDVRRWFEGVTADAAGRIVTFRLDTPDGALLAKLATPFASVLPADTKDADLGAEAPPGTGPYMVAPAARDGGLRLVRNQHFREFSAEAQPDGYPDEITYDFGLSDEAAVTAVLAGRFDWMADPKPLDRLDEILARDKGRARVHLLPAATYVRFDTSVPPFDTVAARQAVAAAVDRAILVRLAGGPNLAAPLCMILPATVVGAKPSCPFARRTGKGAGGPNLELARALVTESAISGAPVVLASGPAVVEQATAAYLAGVLRALGYDTRVVPAGGAAPNASVMTWHQDFPDPSGLLVPLFACDSLMNRSRFCDRAIDAEMASASRITADDPGAASLIWWGVDRAVTRAAPVVPLTQPKWIDLLSSRVGNYVWSDRIGMVFSQVWVR